MKSGLLLVHKKNRKQIENEILRRMGRVYTWRNTVFLKCRRHSAFISLMLSIFGISAALEKQPIYQYKKGFYQYINFFLMKTTESVLFIQKYFLGKSYRKCSFNISINIFLTTFWWFWAQNPPKVTFLMPHNSGCSMPSALTSRWQHR